MSRFVLRTASEPARNRSRRFAPRPAAGILLMVAALLLVVSAVAFGGDALASGGSLDSPRTTLAAGKNDGKAKDKKDGNAGKASGKAVLREIKSSSIDDICGGLQGEIIDGMPICTHGDDPAPKGFDPKRSVEPVQRSKISPRVACIDDGQSGYRYQVLYLYANDAAPGNRFATYQDSIRTWVADVNEIFENSAQVTGGHRQVRFVTDGSCQPVVIPVGLPNTTLRSFAAANSALINLGYNRADRNYLLFADTQVYCGLGSIRSDDRKTQDNYNNTGVSFARVDNGCWSGRTAAHEVMHNLGGVQPSAPNDTGAWHCVDELDIMCYKDSPTGPNMKTVCTTGEWANHNLFDCGQDDYFSANPAPGTYLSRYWNTADSRFLTSATKPLAISPASGPVGAEATVSLNEFPAGQSIAITFDGRTIGHGTVGSNGAAKVTVTVPAATTGNHEVFARTGSRSESVTFRVTPTVSTSGKVKKNGTAKVILTGFGANEQVALKLGNRTLKTVTVDGVGSASTSVKIAGSKKGKATLTAVGASKNSAETALTLRGKTGKGKKSNSAIAADQSAAGDASTAGPDHGGKRSGKDGGKQESGRDNRS